jgi:hypothetical protein
MRVVLCFILLGHWCDKNGHEVKFVPYVFKHSEYCHVSYFLLRIIFMNFFICVTFLQIIAIIWLYNSILMFYNVCFLYRVVIQSRSIPLILGLFKEKSEFYNNDMWVICISFPIIKISGWNIINRLGLYMCDHLLVLYMLYGLAIAAKYIQTHNTDCTE